MIRILNGILILLIGFCGCGLRSGERFITTGDRATELAAQSGFLRTIPGNAMLEDGKTMGDQQNLIYLLVVCPQLNATSRGTTTEFGRRFNAYICHWESSEKKVYVTMKWDKREDKVLLGKRQFARSLGNVFVLIRQSDGSETAIQLPNPGSDLPPKDVLQFIKGHMTNDSLITTLKLPRGA